MNPPAYYSGKIAGYALWLWYLFSLASPATRSAGDSVVLSASLTLFFTGVLIALLSVVSLGRSTRVGLPSEATRLKTGGVYRLSRNPMYVAFAIMSLAAALWLRTPMAFLLAACSIAVYHFIVLGEEKFLLERFGDAYLEYQRRIRRYL